MEWYFIKLEQCPFQYISLLPQLQGTGVKSTQSVLSRLGSVCLFCFAFVRGLFSTSTIFISSNPSLTAMNLSSRLFRLGDNFLLEFCSSPGRADLARGRAGLAQSNLESLWRKMSIEFKKIYELLPLRVALLCAMFSIMFQDSMECAVPLWSDMVDLTLTFSQWVWLPLCLRFYGGSLAIIQLMGLKPDNRANSNSLLCARCALNFALQT